MNESIFALRKQLHNTPELSGQEYQTKALLMDFLKAHTSLELFPCGAGFVAAHREGGAQSAIALRADYDALLTPNGPAHLCGHDGHAAALCAVALELEGATVGRDVFLLFQPAEETGEGAAACCELFAREKVGEIYGAHNLPGFPLGEVVTRPGTFACGSLGLTLHFGGKPTHAAYPEQGISPAIAVRKLLEQTEIYRELSAMCTVIGVHMGEKAFGAAAEQAEVWLTLRSLTEEGLQAMKCDLLNTAADLCRKYGLTFAHEEQDVFPATENCPANAEKVLRLCHGRMLAEPMRWSEDFGHYLHHCPGAFFGIGAGESHPALHTEHYEYPDALLTPTAAAWMRLVQG